MIKGGTGSKQNGGWSFFKRKKAQTPPRTKKQTPPRTKKQTPPRTKKQTPPRTKIHISKKEEKEIFADPRNRAEIERLFKEEEERHLEELNRRRLHGKPRNPTRKPRNPTRKPRNPTRKPISPTRKHISPTRKPISPTRKHISPPNVWERITDPSILAKNRRIREEKEGNSKEKEWMSKRDRDLEREANALNLGIQL